MPIPANERGISQKPEIKHISQVTPEEIAQVLNILPEREKDRTLLHFMFGVSIEWPHFYDKDYLRTEGPKLQPYFFGSPSARGEEISLKNSAVVIKKDSVTFAFPKHRDMDAYTWIKLSGTDGYQIVRKREDQIKPEEREYLEGAIEATHALNEYLAVPIAT